jgi:WXXGXW repeat (2 copies)
MTVKRNLALTLLFTAVISLFGVAPAANAAGVRVNLGVRVGVAPPPLRHEVVRVRPGRGYTWIAGYWDWRPARQNYVWVPGRWVRPRAHSVWVAPRYVTRNHHHYYRHGYWRR